MGFAQVGIKLTRLSRDEQQLLASRLFRRAALSTSTMTSANKDNNNDIEETMADPNSASAGVNFGPWVLQAATAFASDPVSMHQLLSGLYIGASCFFVSRLLPGCPPYSTRVLGLVAGVITSAFAATMLAKPSKNDRPASAGAAGVDSDTSGETQTNSKSL